MVKASDLSGKALSAAALERESAAEIGAAYDLARPELWRAPLIFTSPHSGSIYPQSLLARSDCSLLQLRANEDAFIDRLFAPASKIGAPLLSARFPRCFVDVNRAPTELPPQWDIPNSVSSPRAAAGFGVIPLMMSQDVAIYNNPLGKAALERLPVFYEPYHAALREEIALCLERFGRAVVIDCHSMPGFSALGTRRPDIVLGDRFGLSCSADTLQSVKRAFTQCGYSTARNFPYAGGYVTSHYGRSAKAPLRAIETVQIEINRDLYLNPVTLRPKAKGYAKLARDIHDIIWSLIEDMSAAQDNSDYLRAAE